MQRWVGGGPSDKSPEQLVNPGEAKGSDGSLASPLWPVAAEQVPRGSAWGESVSSC